MLRFFLDISTSELMRSLQRLRNFKLKSNFIKNNRQKETSKETRNELLTAHLSFYFAFFPTVSTSLLLSFLWKCKARTLGNFSFYHSASKRASMCQEGYDGLFPTFLLADIEIRASAASGETPSGWQRPEGAVLPVPWRCTPKRIQIKRRGHLEVAITSSRSSFRFVSQPKFPPYQGGGKKMNSVGNFDRLVTRLSGRKKIKK